MSLIFAQDLLKLSYSFKDSRIRYKLLKMRSYESDKCSHPIYLMSKGTELENYGLS